MTSVLNSCKAFSCVKHLKRNESFKENTLVYKSPLTSFSDTDIHLTLTRSDHNTIST